MKKILFALSFLTVSSFAFAAYEDHFPVYFEYCTGTRWALQTGELGGSPGHGFTYIHGLCKDYRSSYPQVIPCDEVSPELKARFPHEGVGISLDKNFSNVMWVAIPGRNLTIFGDSEPKPMSMQDVSNIIKRVGELKVFQDVVHKGKIPATLPYNSPEYLDAVALETLGTDYAVNWARELHCVRVPAPKETLKNTAGFLNESNNQHKENNPYVWDKISNNCAHLAINTAHEMGLEKSIKLNQKFIGKLLNLALPSNTFMMFADHLVLKKAPNKRRLIEALNEKGFSPLQVGALIENHPPFPSGEYFKTGGLGVLTAPRIPKLTKLLLTPEKYERYMTPENSQLKANAQMWLERYEKLLNGLSSKEDESILESYLQKQIELSKKIIDQE